MNWRKPRTKEQQADDVAAIKEALNSVKNPWSDIVRDNRGYNCWEWKIAALFDVPSGHHLPDEHREVWCQGIKLVLLTKAESRAKGYSLIRMMMQCNGCGDLIPAGRMHQHLTRIGDRGTDQMFCTRKPLVRLLHDVKHSVRDLRYEAGTIVNAIPAVNLPCYDEKGFMWIETKELRDDDVGILLDKRDYELLNLKRKGHTARERWDPSI